MCSEGRGRTSFSLFLHSRSSWALVISSINWLSQAFPRYLLTGHCSCLLLQSGQGRQAQRGHSTVVDLLLPSGRVARKATIIPGVMRLDQLAMWSYHIHPLLPGWVWRGIACEPPTEGPWSAQSSAYASQEGTLTAARWEQERAGHSIKQGGKLPSSRLQNALPPAQK